MDQRPKTPESAKKDQQIQCVRKEFCALSYLGQDQTAIAEGYCCLVIYARIGACGTTFNNVAATLLYAADALRRSLTGLATSMQAVCSIKELWARYALHWAYPGCHNLLDIGADIHAKLHDQFAASFAGL